MTDARRPLVIFGGGALGGALARLAASRLTPVVVASRSPGEHPGWWRRSVVGADTPLGWLPPQADIVVAVSPAPGEAPERVWGARLPAWLDRLRGMRPASILLAGPAGHGTPGLGAFEETARHAARNGIGVLRFPALLSMDRHWAGRIALQLRAGKPARVSLALPPTRALASDDAARAVLASLGSTGDQTLTGPAILAPEAVLAALAERFGVKPRPSMFAPRLDRFTRARLAAQSDLPDAWDDPRFGPRLALQEWAERLPGPRRRRGAASH